MADGTDVDGENEVQALSVTDQLAIFAKLGFDSPDIGDLTPESGPITFNMLCEFMGCGPQGHLNADQMQAQATLMKLFPDGEFDQSQLSAWVSHHSQQRWEHNRLHTASSMLESRRWAAVIAPVCTTLEAELFVKLWRELKAAGTVKWPQFESRWNDHVLSRITNGEHQDAVFAGMTCKTEKMLRDYWEILDCHLRAQLEQSEHPELIEMRSSTKANTQAHQASVPETAYPEQVPSSAEPMEPLDAEERLQVPPRNYAASTPADPSLQTDVDANDPLEKVQLRYTIYLLTNALL